MGMELVSNTMTLSLLLRKLEEATGPDRELDARLHVALFDPQDVLLDPGHAGKPPHRPPVYGAGSELIRDEWSKSDWDAIAHQVGASARYTSSVDEAIVLVEKMLPGWRKSVGEATDGKSWAGYLYKLEDRPELDTKVIANAPTPALALCIALLKALEPARPLEAREG